MNETLAKQVARFQRALAALDDEFVARKQALLEKLGDILGLSAAPAGAKRRAEASGGRPARRRRGRDTLATFIIAILKEANRPMTTAEIFLAAKRKGWRTAAANPKAVVHKTLYRIEKGGAIVRAQRGKFAAAK